MNFSSAASLPALLATLTDPRGSHGLRHPLEAMLAATVCGILTGARGCKAISQWVRNQEPKVWHLLGFQRKPPCANTYRNLLLVLPPDTFEELIGKWMADLVPAGEPDGPIQPVALDGKTLRGTLSIHGKSIHLLSLFDHQTGGVLRQIAMPPDTNEHKAALALLKTVVLKGKLITADAIFCQRDLCQQVVDDGGDYLITVKDNQSELKAAIEAEFQTGFSPL